MGNAHEENEALLAEHAAAQERRAAERKRVTRRVPLPFEPAPGERLVRVEHLQKPHGGRVLVILEVDIPTGTAQNSVAI